MLSWFLHGFQDDEVVVLTESELTLHASRKGVTALKPKKIYKGQVRSPMMYSRCMVKLRQTNISIFSYVIFHFISEWRHKMGIFNKQCIIISECALVRGHYG